MKVGIKRPNKRLHSGQWKAICGFLVMVIAITSVWALVASITLWRRDRDLAKAAEELNDLREDVRRLEERQQMVNGEWDLSADDFLNEPPPLFEDEDDPFALFEEEMGLISGEE